MKVSEIMSGRVVTICQDEPVIAAARLLKRMNLGALPRAGAAPAGMAPRNRGGGAATLRVGA